MARTTLSSLQLFLCMQSHAPSNTAAHFSACKLRLSRSIIIKSYALANLINGISLAAIQIHNDCARARKLLLLLITTRQLH